jgi:hypothetical protein
MGARYPGSPVSREEPRAGPKFAFGNRGDAPGDAPMEERCQLR